MKCTIKRTFLGDSPLFPQLIVSKQHLQMHASAVYTYISALSMFRFGMAPLQIGIGRFSNTELNMLNRRVCFNGLNTIEDECHVLFNCSLYIDLRVNLFTHAKYINMNFEYMDQNTKLSFIMTNSAIVNKTAKTCQEYFQLT